MKGREMTGIKGTERMKDIRSFVLDCLPANAPLDTLR